MDKFHVKYKFKISVFLASFLFLFFLFYLGTPAQPFQPGPLFPEVHQGAAEERPRRHLRPLRRLWEAKGSAARGALGRHTLGGCQAGPGQATGVWGGGWVLSQEPA